MDLIIDSNVCIELVAETLPAHAIAIIKEAIKTIVFYSVITRMEILGFNGEPYQMDKCEELLTNTTEIDLTENIIQKTIELRKAYPKIKLPDLIIAATAIEYNLTLVTHNLSDFKNITGLQIIDSHNL